MDASVSIVIHAGEGDPDTLSAIRILGELVKESIASPFFCVGPESLSDRRVDAEFYSDGGVETVDLYFALSRLTSLSTLRCATVCSVEDVAVVEALSRATNSLVASLKELAPSNTNLIDVRCIAPGTVFASTDLVTLFSPHANRNIVFLPEDLGSHTQFARPLVPGDPTFAEHIAYELSTTCGMWSAVRASWVDDSKPGVILHGDTPVVFSRSQVRVASLPSLPIEQILYDSPCYPIPDGLDEVQDPESVLPRAAKSLVNDMGVVMFAAQPPFVTEREGLGFKATFSRVGRESLRFVFLLPMRLVRSSYSDLRHIGAAAIGQILGENRTIDVVFQGQVHEGFDDFGLRTHQAEDDDDSPAPGGIDQVIWSSLVDEALSAVDGGPTSRSPRLIREGARSRALSDPSLISPSPGSDAQTSAEALRGATNSMDDSSLLVKVAQLLENEHSSAKLNLEDSIDERNQLVETLNRPLVRGKNQALQILFSLLLASLLCVVAILGKAAERLGVDSWSRDTRTIVGGIAVLLVSFILGIALAASVKMRNSAKSNSKPPRVDDGNETVERPVVGASSTDEGLEKDQNPSTHSAINPWVGYTAPILFGVFGWLWWNNDYWTWGSIEKIRPGDIAAVLGVIGAGLYVIGYSVLIRGKYVASAARRVSVNSLIIFSTIVVILGVVDSSGWYGQFEPPKSLYERVLWILVTVLALVFLAIVAVQVRLAMQRNVYEARLLWLENNISHCRAEMTRLEIGLSQFYGTAAALMRVIWRPLGIVGEQPAEGGLKESLSSLQKLQLIDFRLNEDRLGETRRRLRALVGRRGWLQRQYAVAVEAFQQKENGFRGIAQSGARPENDASTRKWGVGVRWRFAQQLHEGLFDHDLKKSIDAMVSDDFLNVIIDSPAIEGPSSQSVVSFMELALHGQAAPIPTKLYERINLPAAGDSNTQFRSHFWVPYLLRSRLPLNSQNGDGNVHFLDNETGHVKIVRVDFTQDFPLRLLPISKSDSQSARPPARGGAPCDDTTSM
jgi:hypothetical protein